MCQFIYTVSTSTESPVAAGQEHRAQLTLPLVGFALAAPPQSWRGAPLASSHIPALLPFKVHRAFLKPPAKGFFSPLALHHPANRGFILMTTLWRRCHHLTVVTGVWILLCMAWHAIQRESSLVFCSSVKQCGSICLFPQNTFHYCEKLSYYPENCICDEWMDTPVF